VNPPVKSEAFPRGFQGKRARELHSRLRFPMKKAMVFLALVGLLCVAIVGNPFGTAVRAHRLCTAEGMNR
jgi:hypothetical protein